MQDLRLLDVAGSHGVSTNFAAETLAAYERWAPLYPPAAHNPLMRAEQCAMLEQWPAVEGRRALDLACGTGRYSRLLAQARATRIVALDFCLPMLRQVSAATRVCASMMQLPFADQSFDVVISGLALGHASNVYAWMTEVARVLVPGGTLLYSDFHPEAARAGLLRSFKDQGDHTWTVPHQRFELTSQKEAAAAANLAIEVVHEVRVGEQLRESFAKSEEFYSRWAGLPIVLVVKARK
jgi:ubiquinone/menaquinone biosynthesis C-methylase UbiE